jgi:hypothetical protein
MQMQMHRAPYVRVDSYNRMSMAHPFSTRSTLAVGGARKEEFMHARTDDLTPCPPNVLDKGKDGPVL